MKKTILVIAIIAVLVGGYFWVQKTREMGNTNPIKIGGLFALTGYAAFAGEASRDGFLMAIEDSGMKIPYVIEDFHSDQKTVLSATNKLINSDHVSVIIGPEWLEFSEVVAPMAKDKKALFVSTWMTGEPEWLSAEYYFSGTPSERNLQRKQLEYMASKGIKKIALAYHNNSWSLGNITMLKNEIVKIPQVQVAEEFVFNQDEKDFRTQLQKINALKPDAIYAAFADDNGQGIFSKQMKEMGMKYPTYVPLSVGENTVLKDRFGEYIIGLVYPAPSQSERMEEFNKKYEQRFGKKPGALSAATAYDMTTLVIAATKNGARNIADIQQYLAQVKDYNGYSNKITFDSLGQVVGGAVTIREITKDGYKIIE